MRVLTWSMKTALCSMGVVGGADVTLDWQEWVGEGRKWGECFFDWAGFGARVEFVLEGDFSRILVRRGEEGRFWPIGV